jgi:hypothetical protein
MLMTRFYFFHPRENEIHNVLSILNLFGEASGLKTNIQKSSVYPIRCGEEELITLYDWLPCELSSFPCKYLGLPLCLKKLSKNQVQPIIDRVADQLSRWKADLMTRAGIRVQVQYVMTGMLIYLAMAVDIPPGSLKAIDKIRKGFLWHGRKDVRGGHCLVAWGKVCRPLEIDGLGISSLKELGWALRMRWLWLSKTEPDKPWSSLPMQFSKKMKAFVYTAMLTKIGNGSSTLFWQDRWIHGKKIEDLAPRQLAAVPNRIRNSRTVLEALTDRKWLNDIKGALTVGVFADLLDLWDALQTIQLCY